MAVAAERNQGPTTEGVGPSFPLRERKPGVISVVRTALTIGRSPEDIRRAKEMAREHGRLPRLIVGIVLFNAEDYSKYS